MVGWFTRPSITVTAQERVSMEPASAGIIRGELVITSCGSGGAGGSRDIYKLNLT